jgi:hypothetical protein
MRPEVPAILGVLRHAAIAQRGVLNVSDVEALDEVVAEHKSLRLALADMFALLDEKLLVRDTTGDGSPSWVLKGMELVVRLKNAHDALELAGKP